MNTIMKHNEVACIIEKVKANIFNFYNNTFKVVSGI